MLLRRRVKGPFTRLVSIVALLCALAPAAEPPLVPLTVCEVLRDLAALDGKTVVMVGRYSFRPNGRWMAEQSCDGSAAANPAKPQPIWLTEDVRSAPKPPGDFELDAVALHRKLADIQRRTSLGKFKFGNPEYDRWAMVYGRIEARKGDALKQAAADLVFRGSGVLVFMTAEE